MNRAVVSVGSNVEPFKHVEEARRLLAREQTLVAESSFEMTRPEGRTSQPDFLNGAFLVDTDLGAGDLAAYLKGVEARLGRKRGSGKDGPRTIDLDLIVFNGRVVSGDYHRYGFVRRFVLELAPGLEG
ncbi:MAG: 2-amino-4-hydroxy-6-hydroxymethyldihydropteridine diphosphokinase [Thermodesulfobacteriota bacterium]